MKSYYKFLETTKTVGEKVSTTRKPVFRASSIFPVIHTPSFTSCISFMGYWLIKRQIKEVSVLYTLRDQSGQIMLRNSLLIETTRVFVLDLPKLLQEAGKSTDIEFQGSLEIEVFSTRNLFYTYPAIILCFYNESFSTAVHTTGRIYNDVEDLEDNEESLVAESGFDIYGTQGVEPFCAFTNGPFGNISPEIAYTVINHRHEEFKGTIHLPELNAYETHFLYFKKYIDLETMLDGKVGAIKLQHNFKGFFPRLICGNFDSYKQSTSITHSFYDCSARATPQDYWNKKDPQNHDASMMIPLYLEGPTDTELVFYPIYSPSTFELSIDLYGRGGNRITSVPNYKIFDTRKPIFERINFTKLVKEKGIDPSQVTAANLLFNASSDHQIPTRIKMGLNVGQLKMAPQLASNICFAPKVGDSDAQKPQSFHWSPLLNFGTSKLVITNASSSKTYNRSANLRLNFFRVSDDLKIYRETTLKPFGQYQIDVESDSELKTFFQNEIGWVTIEADNPYVNGWYFDFHPNGTVAGDHFF